MDTYSALRHFADSWGLLALVVVFLAAVLRTFRPGSRAAHKDSAAIPFRNDRAPAPEPMATPAAGPAGE